MIYPGTDLKFRVTTEIPDFQLSEDAFEIVVRDRYKRTVARITRDDCFYDDQGQWYFTLEKVRSGWYYAFFSAFREDEDYGDQRATYNDVQPLCCVGYCEKHAPKMHDCDKGQHKVHYEQVWVVSVDGADYLADCDGRYIYTSDGMRIQFTNEISEQIEDMGKVKMQMNGKEFLRQWEGRSQTGEVDTVPELYDALRGIADDKTVVEEVTVEVAENTPDRVTQEELDNFEL